MGTDSAHPIERHFLLRFAGWFVILVLAGICLLLFRRAVVCSHSISAHTEHLGKLSQIRLALLQYEERHGCLPPVAFSAGDGGHLHSWRVLLLPYLSETDLYEQYNFDEPWDGPENRSLLERIPSAYALADTEDRDGNTGVVAVTGMDTVLGSAVPTIPKSETIVAIEAKNSKIPWTKPSDITENELMEWLTKGDLQALSHSGYKLAVLSIGPESRTFGLDFDSRPDEIAAVVYFQSEDRRVPCSHAVATGRGNETRVLDGG